MINSFNCFCKWVATTILSHPRIKDRVKCVETFIMIAKVSAPSALLSFSSFTILTDSFTPPQHLHELNNFNTLMALLAGLRSGSVYRLVHTRVEISRKFDKVC